MFEMVPEGQEGWATFFLRKGFGVFTITWVGQKRSGEGGAQVQRLRNQDGYNLLYDKTSRAIAELLDLIGPAIIVGKSQGGPHAYRVMDLRPQLVKGAILIAPGQVGGTEVTNYPALRPVEYDETTGKLSNVFPFEPPSWTPGGEPDFTGDYFTVGPGMPNPFEMWQEYKRTPAGREDDSQPPRDTRGGGLIKNPLTPVGSADRPTKNVTFTDTKIIIMTGEEDQNKGLDWNPAFVAAMKRAGVKDVESIELTRYNGFPHEDHFAELGQNVERLGYVALDWLVRKGLAVAVP